MGWWYVRDAEVGMSLIMFPCAQFFFFFAGFEIRVHNLQSRNCSVIQQRALDSVKDQPHPMLGYNSPVHLHNIPTQAIP